MSDINTRIMQIMREKNLNKNSLSKILGISQPALKKIEDNINAPSFKLLFEILSNFEDVSPEWLMTGKGTMIKENNPQNTPGGGTVPIEVYMESQKQVTELIAMLKSCQDQLGKMIGISKDLVTKGNGAPQDNDVGCADVG